MPETTAAKNVATWFELPTRDFGRAKRFYEQLLEVKLQEQTMGPARMGVFPHAEDEVSGCILAMEGSEPSLAGSVVYVNTRFDLQRALDRVERAGGQTLVPKTALPEGMGFFAQIRDSEGNRVGLYSTS